MFTVGLLNLDVLQNLLSLSKTILLVYLAVNASFAPKSKKQYDQHQSLAIPGYPWLSLAILCYS